MKCRNPRVDIESFYLPDGRVTIGKKHWDMSTIIGATKNLPVYDLQLSAIDLSTYPWGDNGYISDFLFQMKRVQEADLSFPIVQNPNGFIIDGWHRVCKAILNGQTTIKAVRLVVMPEPDMVEKD